FASLRAPDEEEELMPTRRTILMAPLAQAAASAAGRDRGRAGKMTLALHQNTSLVAGFKGSLEGWAKAGIKNVELTSQPLDEFLKTESLASAKRVIGDLGLTPVCGAAAIPDFWNPNPGRAAAMEVWKRRCEQYATLGIPKIYNPAIVTLKITADDYKGGVDCIREAGEAAKQHGLTAMIEFMRNSAYISTLTTLLKLTRAAGHPNVKPLLDCYHFYSGMSKLEDLDLLQPGELGHVHFQDVPDMPRELLDSTTRLIPGDGVSPLNHILKKLAEKKYSGPLSVELFLPEYQKGDPFQVATEIQRKATAVMRRARVA
ncbi:MAG: sugar phosphate isomerase/epimerase, partial [Bryobacteraceae bacterium]